MTVLEYIYRLTSEEYKTQSYGPLLIIFILDVSSLHFTFIIWK